MEPEATTYKWMQDCHGMWPLCRIRREARMFSEPNALCCLAVISMAIDIVRDSHKQVTVDWMLQQDCLLPRLGTTT